MNRSILPPGENLAAFCRRHHIRRLSVFGSVLGEDFRGDSDIDVLVEFEPAHTPGFMRLCQIEDELSGLVQGHKIDLVTPGFLNRHIRDSVLSSAQELYVEG
jgi:hypothetical protein